MATDWNQNKLIKISDILCDNIEDVFDALDIRVNQASKYYYCKCPIHISDKSGSLMIYPEGHTHRGYWRCVTKGCHSYFKPTIIGFIRGVLSSQKYGWRSKNDKYETFENTLKFIEKTFKIDFQNIEVDYEHIEKKKFMAQTNWNIPMAKNKPLIYRNEVKAKLGKPPTYFIKRGFSKEIMEKYDVGYCDDPKKLMYNRVVVPVYNESGDYLVGCQGRSIFDKCEKCGGYHNPFSAKCAEFPKWLNSKNFNKKDSLYNYWFSKEYIKKSRTAILVESCGNVWKLEEFGIKNSVGLFGNIITDGQEFLLEKIGCMNIIIILDNDEAGISSTKNIQEKLKQFYNIKSIYINGYNDIAEMDEKDIKKQILDII